ncbi:transglutaminase-like domain-containing protein [Salinispira pacifica]
MVASSHWTDTESELLIGELANGVRYRIRYQNAQGEQSEREIRLYRSYRSRYGQRYLDAFCFLTEERRTFRRDRIISAKRVDESGEHPVPSMARADPPARPQPSPSPPRAPKAQQREAGMSGGGAVYGVIVALAAFVLVIALGSRSDQKQHTVPGSAETSVVESAARIAMNQTKSGALQATGRFSMPTETIAVGRFIYRDYAVIAERGGGTTVYSVPALHVATPSLRGAYLAINAALFEKRTGIHDPRIEAIFASADTDGNGHLSWAEIVDFQRAIYRVFKYKANATALRPDEFLDHRGGDCEDWALFTAGLLHYWGWNASIATFVPPDGSSGHAVAFVRVDQPIPGIGSYTVSPAAAARSKVLPGTYIPIDYSDVGGFTTALEPGSRLTHLYNPESLYDRVM